MEHALPNTPAALPPRTAEQLKAAKPTTAARPDPGRLAACDCAIAPPLHVHRRTQCLSLTNTPSAVLLHRGHLTNTLHRGPLRHKTILHLVAQSAQHGSRPAHQSYYISGCFRRLFPSRPHFAASRRANRLSASAPSETCSQICKSLSLPLHVQSATAGAHWEPSPHERLSGAAWSPGQHVRSVWTRRPTVFP
jgi:hypothetical protein